MAKRSLRPQLNQIRAWVRQGRTDAWIAHQLEIGTSELREFRRQHGLSPDDEDGTAEVDLRDEIEAEIAEASEAEEEEEEGQEEEEAKPAEPAGEEPEPDGGEAEGRPRRRRRRGRRGDAEFEGQLAAAAGEVAGAAQVYQEGSVGDDSEGIGQGLPGRSPYTMLSAHSRSAA